MSDDGGRCVAAFLPEPDGCQGGIPTPSWYGCGGARNCPTVRHGVFGPVSPPAIDSSRQRPAGGGRKTRMVCWDATMFLPESWL